MLKSSARSAIRLRGVRHNNLKNLDLDLPLNQLIVITGLSGSGKSSLAFDTLFAEGQRRYIETFSPYARQFFDRMDKPQADSIEGIPPAIAIEQRNSVKTTRSTVGTMTEICDYMKMLWPHIAQLHCRQCGRPVRKNSPQMIWDALQRGVAENGAAKEVLITFDLPLTEKLSLEDSLALVAKQGYQRLLLGDQIVRLDEAFLRITHHAPAATAQQRGESRITIIQDRLAPGPATRPRFIEACEQAYHFGKGKLALHELAATQSDSKLKTKSLKLFSNRLYCAACDIEYRESSPALFSFNHPVGACPTCRGFGRIINIDYNIALPDRSKTLDEGVVKPWQTGLGAECQSDLLRMCRQHGVPTNVPFDKLAKKWQDFVIEGEPGYGKDPAHEWPRAWYGIKGYFRWLESKAYKMHVRVLLSRYRTYTPCPDCHGKRFQPETLLYRVPERQIRASNSSFRNPPSLLPSAISDLPSSVCHLPSAISRSQGQPKAASIGSSDGLTLADFYQLPVQDALAFIESLAADHQLRPNDPLGIILGEVRARLGYLNEVGLGYLTLDRPTRSLSGGETERVSLTTCLGTRLVNTLFVLDEPSVGLHPRDTERLVRILQQLRDAGNTVIVVEHDASVMRAADQILDLGPGHGATGGQVVFQGAYSEVLKSSDSLTGQYLSGRKRIDLPERRSVELRPSARRHNSDRLTLSHAARHNIKNLTVQIPLDRFVCITGVSGSGKTTLVREVLLPALEARLKSEPQDAKASDRLETNQNDQRDEPDSALDPQASTRLAGAEHLGRVILVDQSILGKTPRSNPAVYIGAFDDIREFFAQSELARQRGLNASAFSFNSSQGQCERCRGAGFEKIEMQFLSDVFIRCPDCNGRRYRAHILEVKIAPHKEEQRERPPGAAAPSRITFHVSRFTHHLSRSFSIADLLDATVEEAIDFLAGFSESRPARRAVESLQLLREVGLGYLKLGQPINTLSGGESQRLKLVRHLADATQPSPGSPSDSAGLPAQTGGAKAPRPTLFLFDEPTTGLHFDDVRVLLKVFQRLVDAGHSVIVIEHNLDVIKSADWIIDLGPDAGDQGGRIVAEGTPEQIAGCPASHTGRALREVLK
jgi:excinuclease ABC subunit A